ncbi:MAG: hypothetical protein K2W97_07180 [Chthoniobacterales bacterium]|nr:hypothetical protein [Chthoniobacterales bacterium]
MTANRFFLCLLFLGCYFLFPIPLFSAPPMLREHYNEGESSNKRASVEEQTRVNRDRYDRCIDDFSNLEENFTVPNEEEEQNEKVINSSFLDLNDSYSSLPHQYHMNINPQRFLFAEKPSESITAPPSSIKEKGTLGTTSIEQVATSAEITSANIAVRARSFSEPILPTTTQTKIEPLNIKELRSDNPLNAAEVETLALAEKNLEQAIVATKALAVFRISPAQDEDAADENSIFTCERGLIVLGPPREQSIDNIKVVKNQFIEAAEYFYGKDVMAYVFPVEERNRATSLTIGEVNHRLTEADKIISRVNDYLHKYPLISQKTSEAVVFHDLTQEEAAAAESAYGNLEEPAQHLVDAIKYSTETALRAGAAFLALPIAAVGAARDSANDMRNYQAALYARNALPPRDPVILPILAGLIGGVIFAPQRSWNYFSPGEAAKKAANAATKIGPSQLARQRQESAKAKAHELLNPTLKAVDKNLEELFSGNTALSSPDVHELGETITELALLRDNIHQLIEPNKHQTAVDKGGNKQLGLPRRGLL